MSDSVMLRTVMLRSVVLTRPHYKPSCSCRSNHVGSASIGDHRVLGLGLPGSLVLDDDLVALVLAQRAVALKHPRTPIAKIEFVTGGDHVGSHRVGDYVFVPDDQGVPDPHLQYGGHDHNLFTGHEAELGSVGNHDLDGLWVGFGVAPDEHRQGGRDQTKPGPPATAGCLAAS